MEPLQIAESLSPRQRDTLAWIIEDWPYPYRGSQMDDVQGLVKLGLLDPPTEDSWGDATPLGRQVWKHARPVWISEHELGAAFRRSGMKRSNPWEKVFG